jgi:hypothetical protein
MKLTTSTKSFGGVGPAGDKITLFNITAGIDAELALDKASQLLELISISVESAAMCESKFDGPQAFLVLHSVETAKAIIDALLERFYLEAPDVNELGA